MKRRAAAPGERKERAIIQKTQPEQGRPTEGCIRNDKRIGALYLAAASSIIRRVKHSRRPMNKWGFSVSALGARVAGSVAFRAAFREDQRTAETRQNLHEEDQ